MLAPPASTALRLAKVPWPYGVDDVSPHCTRTSSIVRPSSSATSCANVVSCPWPWLWLDTCTSTWPDGSMRSVAES